MKKLKDLGMVALSAMMITATYCCKKSGMDNGTVQIKVVEYKTNTPIAGATVELQTGQFDITCFCWPDVKTLTFQTDNNGNCTIGQKDLDNGLLMLISMQGYYELESSFNFKTSYEMDRVGNAYLELVKTKSYPDSAFLNINCAGEQTYSSYAIPVDAIPYPLYGGFSPLPADTVFAGNVFAGQTNTISWYVGVPDAATGRAKGLDSGSVKLDVPLNGDTTKIQIQY